MHDNEVPGLLWEPLEFPTDNIDIAFTAKPTYKIRITYGVSAITMCTADCLLDTGAGAIHIRSSMLPPSWKNRIKHENVPQLFIPKKQLLLFDRLILLQFRLAELTKKWFRVHLHLTEDIPLSTLLIDRFIRGIFLSERRVVSWLSKPVPILAHTK